MAKVVPLHGQRPGGWAKDRWAWIGAVMAAPGLSPTTKLIAVTMAQGFANHETAECRPGLAALMAATGAARRTALLALSDLRKAGWIAPKGGEAPGRAAAYVFRWPTKAPERVQTPAPERVQTPAPERVQADAPERVQETTPTGAKNSIPPEPPYKDKPHMNHNAHPHPRAALRPDPPPKVLTHIIAPGSSRAAQWDEWLAAEGFAPLERIGWLVEGGYRMPVSVAPPASDMVAYSIARRWADWLRKR